MTSKRINLGNMKRSIYKFLWNFQRHLPASLIVIIERCYGIIIKHKYYSKSNKSVDNASDTLICMFDGRINHGGLSDRINGMISSYLIARNNNLKFKIYHKVPFDIESFLVPNKYDWHIENTNISYNSYDSKPVLMRANRIRMNSKLNLYSQNLKNYKQYHCYSNFKFCDDNLFYETFHLLFKASDLLDKNIKIHLNCINGKYVSITYRFQQLLGDFKEGYFKILNNNSRLQLINECLSQIESIRKENPNKKILVTSDSNTFLELASKLKDVYVIPGKIVHMAYSEDADINIHLKSFLDLFLIANAEKIYSIVIDSMYDSSFPLLASKIYKKPFFLIKGQSNKHA